MDAVEKSTLDTLNSDKKRDFFLTFHVFSKIHNFSYKIRFSRIIFWTLRRNLYPSSESDKIQK